MKICRILSIDGGGIRGIIPAVILQQIEFDLKQSSYNLFDICAGSSAGALIVAQINALKYSADKIVFNFTDKKIIQSMFDKHFFSAFSLLHGSKYSGKSKTKMINSIIGKGIKFTDIQKPTLITAYDLSNKTAVVFKNTGGSDTQTNPTVAEIIDASSAAPTYFPPIKINGNYLVDGGIASNDPSMCAIAYAINLGYSLNQIKVLSLGTGYSKKQYSIRKDHVKSSQSWGELSWLKHGIISDLMTGNTSISEYQSKTLLKNNHLRINPELNLASPEMDNIEPENIQHLIDTGNIAYLNNKELIADFFKD